MYIGDFMEEVKRKSPKRLILNLPEWTHHEVKKKALDRNVTMRTWVLRAIMDAIRKEQLDQEN